jgi:hypothetical protein
MCGITIRDLQGSGIDVSTVDYRISHDNISHYGSWTSWNGMLTDSQVIHPRVEVLVHEGPYNYIQWRAIDIAGNGYTASGHYNVRADTMPIGFDNFQPTSIQNTSELTVTVVPSDGPLGSGVEWSSVQYRFRVGHGSYSDWMDTERMSDLSGWEDDTESDPSLTMCGAHLTGLQDGADNFIQFTGMDGIDNGPSVSKEFRITVDTTGPEINQVTPGSDEIQKLPHVTFTIILSDEVSGVDITQVSYCFGTEGEDSIGSWHRMPVEAADGTFVGMVVIDLARGRNNVVQFRAWDNVGNQNISQLLWIPVNILPIARIHSPAPGAKVDGTHLVRISSRGSFDPDGDALNFTWYLDGGSEVIGREENLEIRLPTGPHEVTLVVTDVHGGEATHTVPFTIEKLERDPWITSSWVIVIMLVSIVMIISIIWIRQRSKSEEWEILDDQASLE